MPASRTRRLLKPLAAMTAVLGLIVVSPSLTGVDRNAAEPPAPTPRPAPTTARADDGPATVYELTALGPDGTPSRNERAWIDVRSGAWRVQEPGAAVVVHGATYAR